MWFKRRCQALNKLYSRYKYLTFDIIKFTREDGQVYYVNADKIVMIKPADLFEQEDAKNDAKD